MSGGITFAWEPIRRRAAEAKAAGMFLTLIGSDRSIDVPYLLDEAIRRANRELHRQVAGGVAVRTPDQGVGAALFWDGRTPSALKKWLGVCCDQLTMGGLGGQLTASRRTRRKSAALAGAPSSAPTAFVGYRMEDFPPPSAELLGWHVGVETTRHVADFATKWAGGPGVECWAACSTEAMEIEESCAVDFLCSAADVAAYGATLIYPVDSRKLTHCTMAPRGEFIAQSIERPGHWQAQVADLVELLLAAPEAADVGVIKRARDEAASWLAIGQQTNKPARLVIDYQASRHLWDRYVIDAHGVNLLTDDHLNKADDLSGWTVEEVVPGRHLVKAKNLAPWYSGGPTPHDVVQRARADFGKMILDWDTIQTHPGPYSNLNPNIVGR